ncbi:MAG: arylsulfatase [Bacteroidota bacterium]
MKFFLSFTIILAILIVSCQKQQVTEQPEEKKRPNILIMLVDDMGYSDIGSFGSEIGTPNLDALATGGLKMTRFYNAARCCPSRASLLTGLYPHQAGVGSMVGDWGHPSYRGFLSDKAVTIAEVLKGSDYTTYQVGKWHVGEKPEHWPHKRGFDQHFTFVNGASSYYNLWPYRENQDSLQMAYNGKQFYPEEDFFMPDAFSDTAAAFIERHNPEKPLFMYLAYKSPHWPLHAKPEDIAKYKGKYRMGWDSLRIQRYNRMKELGVIDGNVPLSDRYPTVKAWDDLSEEEKEDWDSKMALYAAVVDRMDQGIGKVVNSLKAKGELDNTLIIFLSDNGACHEVMPPRNSPYPVDGEPGSERSYPSYDPPWANASNTPYRFFKSYLLEGGMSTPFIAHYPKEIPAGITNNTTIGHIMDLMSTTLDFAGVAYPSTFQGKTITPTPGKSLATTFRGDAEKGHKTLFWEHNRNRAVRQGNWKMVSSYRVLGEGVRHRWELYNLEEDPVELNDLAASKPEKVAEMQALYDQWTQETNVLSVEQLDSLHKVRAGS